MTRRSIIAGLLPVGSLLAACTYHPQEPQTVAVDTSGQVSPYYSQGYAELAGGNPALASRYLAQSQAGRPDDPFQNLNLAAAYQNSGDTKDAVPLYRNAIAQGANVYGTEYTRPEVKSMSVADVAKWNLRQAGLDEAGNPIRQSAALAAPAAKKYQVYFAFDRATVTPEGRAVIDEAAKSALAGNLVRITAVGHTDTVGTAAYNQRLSVRRAQAVERVLAADGVPAGDIVTRGVGKTDLAVPTADGVRQPRNRRVEITAEEVQAD